MVPLSPRAWIPPRSRPNVDLLVRAPFQLCIFRITQDPSSARGLEPPASRPRSRQSRTAPRKLGHVLDFALFRRTLTIAIHRLHLSSFVSPLSIFIVPFCLLALRLSILQFPSSLWSSVFDHPRVHPRSVSGPPSRAQAVKFSKILFLSCSSFPSSSSPRGLSPAESTSRFLSPSFPHLRLSFRRVLVLYCPRPAFV